MGTIFKEKGTFMDIEKSKDNFNKDERPWCFNCNIYEHITKKYQRLKKDKETRRCYKCDKIGHLVKDCRSGQKMKNRSVQKESDEENDTKQEGFVKDSE